MSTTRIYHLSKAFVSFPTSPGLTWTQWNPLVGNGLDIAQPYKLLASRYWFCRFIFGTHIWIISFSPSMDRLGNSYSNSSFKH